MVGVASKGIMFITDFVKTDQLIQILKIGSNTHRHTQQDNFISFHKKGNQTKNKVSDHPDAI
jgi:hypothetical protein